MRVALFPLLAGLCAAGVIPRQATNCTNPEKRVEWRQMTADNQQQYVASVLCLKTKSSRIGLSTSLYDDFPYVHVQLDAQIHYVAQFLPWHRFFVQIYEETLRDCGYMGPMAYWDWTLDSADMPASTIWDPVTGFGGDGNSSVLDGYYKCVTDGPFKDLHPSYLAGNLREHCLARAFNNGTAEPGNMFNVQYTPERVAEIHAHANFPSFHNDLETGPHGAIHSAVGGDLFPSSSPNEPLFFLHHVQIDRLWWLWQQENPQVRNAEFAGNKTQARDSPAASVDDVMPYRGLAPDITVSQALTTENSLMCYNY